LDEDAAKIAVFDGERWQEVDLAPGLGDREPLAMFVDPAGIKWFASDQKIARFDDQSWQVYSQPQQVVETGQVKTIYITQSLDTIWLGTTESIWSFDLNATWIEHRPMPNQAVGAEVFYQDPLGHLWTGNELGLFSVSDEGWTYHGYHWAKDRHGSILSMVMDDREQMWVGGQGGIGMWSSDGKRWIHFEEPSKTMLNFVLDVEKDRNGTIWFAGYGGVIQFVPSGPKPEIYASLPQGSDSGCHQSASSSPAGANARQS
jgi:ligand-binding sensor domain-containing protein